MVQSWTFALDRSMTWQFDIAFKHFEMQNFVSLELHMHKDCKGYFFSVKKEYKAKFPEKAIVINLMELHGTHFLLQMKL